MLLTNRLHYAWVIVFTGTITVIAVLGLGRFSLGMLLPSMGADLTLSYSKMGFISTGNFIGYLLAVLISSRMIHHFGYRWVISSGVFIVGSSMILMGMANGFLPILTAFFCTGVGSGLANVPIMVLASHWFGPSLRGRATGLMVSGSGLGIMFTGLLVPYINSIATTPNGWRINWKVLGCLVVAIAGLCTLFLRNDPQELGLSPLEKNSPKKNPSQSSSSLPSTAISKKRILTHLGAVYFCFGFTYVIYVTFVITTLINDYHYTETVAGKFWFWFGLLGIFSGPIFGSVSDRAGRANTLAFVYVLQAVSHLLLALRPWEGSIYLSIALFALCAWSVPSIVAATVSDYLGPLQAASGFAMVTLLFGIGQIIGPALAGALAETYGSFSPAYSLAAILTGLAAIASFMLPQKRNSTFG